VFFDVAIGGETVGRLTFALFGKEAPTITGNFLKVLDGKAQGASYDFSTVWRVQKASALCCVGWLVGWLGGWVGGWVAGWVAG
jgi:hypothetical protein